MASNKKLLVLPGDGVGPEVMGQVRRVVDWMDKRRHVSFDLSEGLCGGSLPRRLQYATYRRDHVRCVRCRRRVARGR